MADCMDVIQFLAGIFLWISLTIVFVLIGWVILSVTFPFIYGGRIGLIGQDNIVIRNVLSLWGVPAMAISAGIVVKMLMWQEFIVRMGILEESEEQEYRSKRIGNSGLVFSLITFLVWTSVLLGFHANLLGLSVLVIIGLQVLVISLVGGLLFLIQFLRIPSKVKA